MSSSGGNGRGRDSGRNRNRNGNGNGNGARNRGGNGRAQRGRGGRNSSGRRDRDANTARGPAGWGDTHTGDPMEGPRILERPPPKSFNGEGTAILWVRNDLRVLDNEALTLANTASHLVPVYVFDERYYGTNDTSPHGFQRTGPFRAHFLKQSVKDFRRSLRWKGSDVIVRVGITEDIIAEVAQQVIDAGLGPVRVVAHKEVTREETDMEEAVANAVSELTTDSDAFHVPIETHFVWGYTLLHLDDLPINPAGPALPPTFTEFRKLVEAHNNWYVRDEIQAPKAVATFPREIGLETGDLPSLRDDLEVEGLAPPHDYPFPHPLGAMNYEGGEKMGLDRIDDWIWKVDALKTYFDTRNGSGNSVCSSKFSAWLAAGCISPRTIYWNCQRYEEKVVANKSTYWMVFELLTRDYFKWVAARVGTKLFALNGFSGRARGEPDLWHLPHNAITPKHTERFEAWKEGRTGAPFVDSSMRELRETGFMSNRGRQNVASFLVHDLEYPDWRAGAEYFESVLIDHDVAANWGNWAYLAGVGSDPRNGRRFNVVKQAVTYDETGWFTKRWCPELIDIPPPFVHEPHRISDKDLRGFNVEPGKTYPRPIVQLLRGPKHDQVINPSMYPVEFPAVGEIGNPSKEVQMRMSAKERELLEEMKVYRAEPGEPGYEEWNSKDEQWARKEAERYTDKQQ